MTNKATLTTSKTVAFEQSNSQQLLAFCKATADQLRLDILSVLSKDSYGVLELCSIFDSKQSSMSHHLKILANAGLVTFRREGNSIFYRRAHRQADDALSHLQQALQQAIDQQVIPEYICQQVQAVRQERANNSQLFFAENANRFRQQQEQIAAYELYGPNTIELINRYFAAEPKPAIALEVGPGEGAFLAELAPRFQQVYALDNSPTMLEKATAFAKEAELSNIHFIQSDTGDKKVQNLNADCVVVNMVLHHTPTPADIFADIAKILKTNGQLFVTDLCSHDQNWVRESCGDLWLGFSPEDLTEWAATAGFKAGENIFLAQRNGFRVQIHQFINI
jgi:ArsR family transcriptional regulator